MADFRKNGTESLTRRHFSKIHERIQNKYNEMQRKLEKSKSVDSLNTFNEDYVFVDNKYSSHIDIRESDRNDENNLRHSAILEEVNLRCSPLQFVNVEQVSISESEATPFEEFDNESITNNFFGDDISQMSVDSLNDVSRDFEEYQLQSSPPPTNSIRNRISLRISAVKEKRREKQKRAKDAKEKSEAEKFILSNTKQDLPRFFKKTKLATVSIAIIEATGLVADALDEKSFRSLSCRLRLGSEKGKTKAVRNTSSEVKWQEIFCFNLFDDNILELSLFDNNYCMGRNQIDLSEMEKERTHKMRIDMPSEVGNSKIQIFILLTISGLSLANTLVDLNDYQETQRQLAKTRNQYAWYHLRDKSTNIGSLSVIVYGARGLWGQDCCCILELNNERLQTHMEPKTSEPNWMKIFTFDVTDVTSIMDITVFDEKKSEEIGKISIPLLKIESGEKRWYALKDPNLRDRARGNNPRILLEMILTWNLVKAAHKVINIKEVKYLQTRNKLDRHMFARNLARARVVLNWFLNAMRVSRTFLEWESRKVNFISLIIWLLFCWFFKMWMLPLLLLIPFVWYRPPEYFLINWKSALMQKKTQKVEEVKKEEKSPTLLQKINNLQEMLQTVQNFLSEFANLGETIKNLFNFTVPFVSFTAIFLITVTAFVMFMIPTRYILMIWGIHKFTRKIRRPNRIPHNEILDLLSRVPNDEILLNCEEIALDEVPDEDVIK